MMMKSGFIKPIRSFNLSEDSILSRTACRVVLSNLFFPDEKLILISENCTPYLSTRSLSQRITSANVLSSRTLWLYLLSL
jgi:hypothetical protein